MMVTDVDPLKHLQSWYVFHCDGSWEHAYGISITSLDNPGWRFKVDLTDTELMNRTFDEVVFEGKDKNDWYQMQSKRLRFRRRLWAFSSQ
jgi:hypothetical protein